jgi:hypothetical protein
MQYTWVSEGVSAGEGSAGDEEEAAGTVMRLIFT